MYILAFCMLITFQAAHLRVSMEESAMLPQQEDDYGKGRGSLPVGIKYLVWNEFCERFSFYGMKTVLALYLLEHLRLSEDHSTEVVHLFIVLCYATPLIGALISDSFLGKYRTILYLSVLYSFGNWVMALSAAPHPKSVLGHKLAFVMTVLGLILIGFGTGGIKPCVSAFGGDQIEYTVPDGEVKDKLRMRFFSLFYFAINAGSLISTVLTPVLRANLSYVVAFAVPAVLMVCALVTFWLGRVTYVDRPPAGNVFRVVGGVIIDALKSRKENSNSVESSLISGVGTPNHWLDHAKLKHGDAAVEDVKSVLRVLILFLPTPLFWSLFDQQSSKWIFQAQQLDGRLTWLGGLVIQPDQMQALNPVLILILIPLFDQLVYPSLESRGIRLNPVSRMVCGMLLSTSAFVLSGILQIVIDMQAAKAPARQLCILWQVPQYVVVTAGEILFSITGLEFAYSQAPHTMKSVVQSIWLVTVAAGNLVTVVIVAIIGDRLSNASEFFFFAAGSLVATLSMVWIGSGFNYSKAKVSQGHNLLDEDESSDIVPVTTFL